MKKTISLAWTSLVLTLVASVQISQAHAGLEEGVAAAEARNLPLAYKEFRAAAEKGDANCQSISRPKPSTTSQARNLEPIGRSVSSAKSFSQSSTAPDQTNPTFSPTVELCRAAKDDDSQSARNGEMTAH